MNVIQYTALMKINTETRKTGNLTEIGFSWKITQSPMNLQTGTIFRNWPH